MIRSEYQLHNKTKGYSTPSKLRYRIERIWRRVWLRKLILRVLILIFFATSLTSGLLIFKNEFNFRGFKSTMEAFAFERPELSIIDLNIKGANPDLSNQIKAILQLSFPINPLKININYLQELINDVESVDFSKIRITKNGILEVVIRERIPVALHRDDKQLMLLDIDGRRIGEVFSRLDRQDLPLVVGQGANYRVKESLEIYKLASPIINRVRGMILVGERRWDIILDGNLKIKLPEKGAKKAFSGFIESGEAMEILRQDFSAVDLRNRGKVIVRTKTTVIREEKI